DTIAIATPSLGGAEALRVAQMEGEDGAQGELAQIILRDVAHAGEEGGEIGNRHGQRILARVQILLGMEDLRGRTRRIAIDRAHGRPRLPLPELVDEAETFDVGKKQKVPHELRRLADDGTTGIFRDQSLGRREIGQPADVDALGLEEEIEAQGNGFALDESL